MQIANEIAFLGSSLNSYATSDGNNIIASTLKKNLNKTLDILADCILNPTFAEDELKREVTQRLAGIKQGKTDPNTLAENRFTKVVFGDDMPYGNSISGTETSLNSITVSDLKTFYTNYFIPNNTFCIVSGDITLEEAVALLEEKLKGWEKGKSHLVDTADDSKVSTTTKVVVVNRDAAVQSAIRIGCLIPDKANPDINKLSTLNTYLGGYYQSQLFQKLREEKSYTYDVSSSIDARLFKGVFAVRTQVGSQFTEGAVEDILDEIKKLSTTPIPDDRLNEVKSYLIGSFPIMQLQTNFQVTYLLSSLKLYNLPLNYYDNYISSVQGTTKEDLMKIAQKYLDVSKMSIVISGDNEIIAPMLSKFGNVESVDANGQPLK
jgi:predicted Zn-dependent peptidase